MNSLVRLVKTITQVGWLPVLRLGLYRFGLASGHYRRVTPFTDISKQNQKVNWRIASIPFRDSEIYEFIHNHSDLKDACLQEFELISGGKCQIFGNQLVDIFQNDLVFLNHWTEYEQGKRHLPVEDIKFIWEPARLGWLFSLGRAAGYEKESAVGQTGWNLIDEFLTHNPINMGPNWMSGQEVALRILALVFFHEVFNDVSYMPRGWEDKLGQTVIAHARRISSTLVYAQSQQNNHLLVEAAGLYTAGVFLPEQAEAEKWRTNGWQIFHQAINFQIQPDGTYCQFSTNYHRLMLQISLWMRAIGLRYGDEFPERSLIKLASATNWLKNLTHPQTGRVPNYGNNDGAYIIPLTSKIFQDFRPVNQACNYFFLGDHAQPINEMTLWFKWLAGDAIIGKQPTLQLTPITSYQKLVNQNTSGFMFAPKYTSRPGQADILQTEIWQDGKPITLDPGTYSYNNAPPWDNTLRRTKYHNTVTVNEEDQMQRAGRFLWLDWPKVELEDWNVKENSVTASHNGYKKFGIIHKRQMVNVNESMWRVIDFVDVSGRNKTRKFDLWLHWLLPVRDWSIINHGLQVFEEYPRYKVSVLTRNTKINQKEDLEFQLIKGGVLLETNSDRHIPEDSLANFGWYSPTYGILEPAISYRVRFNVTLPFNFYTEFQLS